VKNLPIILVAFSGMFTFAFGMACLMPLATADAEKQAQRKPGKYEWGYHLLDTLAMIAHCLPVFSLMRLINELPGMIIEAREKWRQDATVRGCFYAFVISLACCMASICWMTWD
jgi:hypothetical protein